MPDVNKANRQVCDLYIDFLDTGRPFMDFRTANVTTTGIDSSSVYAMAKGARRIAFQDPLTGTMSVEAQVKPFRFYALYSDGVIEDGAIYADRQSIKCTEAGKLTITVPTDGTVTAGSVVVAPEDSFGIESAVIEGTYADGVYTATTADNIVVGATYRVGYLINRTGVKKISINNKKLPKDYKIYCDTLEKDENGNLVSFKMTAYKASIQRSFELSFSSEGDPASVTATFDLLEDKDGNFLDFIEG